MKILLIEDEPALAENISSYFLSNKISCEIVNSLKTAMDKVLAHDYDCVLLDLSLPDGNGFTILEELKKLKKSEGVIIISAKDTLQTRVEGLNLGADDFLIKPFHLAELLARVQALIRRKNFNGQNKIVFNEIEIDLLAKTCFVKNKPIDLTKTELDLLLFLIANQNKVLAKSSIAEHLSGDMADMLDNHDFVYAHIKNLKRKLADAHAADYIKSVYGLGYKFSDA